MRDDLPDWKRPAGSPLAQHRAEAELVTFRGSRGTRSKQKQPHVNYEGEAYISSALHGRFDLIGQTFWAEHPLHDARKLTLRKVDDATVYVVLTVRGQWKYAEHTVALRKKIKSWIKQGRIDPKEHEDLVTAYRVYVRKHAHKVQTLADEFAKLPKDVRSPAWSPPKPQAQADERPVFLPRGGAIQLGRRIRS